MNRADFLEQAHQAATMAAFLLGVRPEVLMAQAALESGWGVHTPKTEDGDESFNFFGIKVGAGWTGKRAGAWTKEHLNGRWVTMPALFRAYPSLQDGFVGYAHFIAGNPRYRHAIEVAADPEHYLLALQQAGYATDPDYAAKVLRIYRQIIAGNRPAGGSP